MKDLLVTPPIVEGDYSVFYVEPHGRRKFRFNKQNLLLFSWGAVATSATGLRSIGAMYMEFKNVISPGTPVPIPTFDRTAGIAYYNNLPTDVDYLRVPLSGSPALSTTSDFTNYIPSGYGNRLLYTAQSAGTMGENGLQFSDVVNSVVYGVALVATPVPSDPTQDVLLSRGYFLVADQTPKLLGSQIEVQWGIALK